MKRATVARFGQVMLRTTNVQASQVFYSDIFGANDLGIVALPETAAARGAPAHWLGRILVENVEQALASLMQCGARLLGPIQSTGGDGSSVLVRDAGGAVLALAADPAISVRTSVVWYHLNTLDVARAAAICSDIFGWTLTECLDRDRAEGDYKFTWRSDGIDVGSMAEITGRPGMHPHWLFHFEVGSLDAAASAIRAAGGVVIGPMALPDGRRVAVCDDPWGAAFAIRESRCPIKRSA